MAYPNINTATDPYIPVCKGSKFTPVDTTKSEVGNFLVDSFTEVEDSYYDILLVHSLITGTQTLALKAAFDLHEAASSSFTLVYQGDTYTNCNFVAPLKIEPLRGIAGPGGTDSVHTVTSKIVGRKA